MAKIRANLPGLRPREKTRRNAEHKPVRLGSALDPIWRQPSTLLGREADAMGGRNAQRADIAKGASR